MKVIEGFDIDALLEGADKSVADYNQVLSRLGFSQTIDEIAVLFISDAWLNQFTMDAVRHKDLVHFNGANDHVRSLPIDACYNPRYEFFGTGQTRKYRIEAMSIGVGFSPIHFATLSDMSTSHPAPSMTFHASFKCGDEAEYGAAVKRLMDNGWELAQRCESAYGRFSYWRPYDMEHWVPFDRWLYLKPRVNMRDS